MQPALPDITICIVNSSNCQMTLNCLESVVQTAHEMALEIIVVNNACADGSQAAIAARFPQVKTINHAEMLGFSTNNNLAFAQAAGRYLLLLNDDTLVQPGALQAMLAFADAHPEAAVVGANLINPDGSPQKCYDFAPNPFYDALQPMSEILFPLPAANGRPLAVENVNGACMMVRASAARRTGYLDPRFDPIYSEEVDWCYRFRRTGAAVYHLPAARVVHFGGATMNRLPVQRYERIFEKKAVFFRKHYGRPAAALYKTLLLVNNLFKTAAWAALWALGRSAARDETRTHWHMTRRALFL